MELLSTLYTKKATVEYNQAWNFFDAIYCISVRERHDRRHTARKEFAKVGLLPRVEFFLVDKDLKNPERGIYESHLLCIKKGLASGAKTILLFEDDILFRNFSSTRLKECCTSLTLQPQWNALFLGCMVTGINTTTASSLTRIRYQCLTHAYALNADFAKHLVSQGWQGIPYDGLLKKENTLFFALHPMPAFQNNSPTDNKTIQIDRFRRILGGLERLQRLNNFYYLHKKSILFSHIAAGILLGLLFFTK